MSTQQSHRLKIAVGIATRGRPEILRSTLALLEQQTRLPDHTIIAAPTSADAGENLQLSTPHSLVLAQAGLTRQRNALLDAAKGFDITVFFDDDFYPCRTYLAEVERLFVAQNDVVLVTGHVIADGIKGPGLTMARAKAALDADQGPESADGILEPAYNVYGCNFAVRMRATQAGVFDEQLPLYGWLEDVDFSRRLASQGRIVRCLSMRGVHLGVKSGRQPGVMLGYSQIANPVHLVRKGTFTFRRALFQMARNVAMNLCFSFTPEPYVDRRGRLRGNLTALKDLVLGRVHPERILTLR